jgi:hypothetical protein
VCNCPPHTGRRPGDHNDFSTQRGHWP